MEKLFCIDAVYVVDWTGLIAVVECLFKACPNINAHFCIQLLQGFASKIENKREAMDNNQQLPQTSEGDHLKINEAS